MRTQKKTISFPLKNNRLKFDYTLEKLSSQKNVPYHISILEKKIENIVVDVKYKEANVLN